MTPFVDHTKAFGPVSGAAISNMPMPQAPSGYPGVPAGRSFDGGVAVIIEHVDGSAYATPERDDSAFPLDLSRATTIRGEGILSDTLSFRGNGVDYIATFGNQGGSPADIRALDEVIRSIRFRGLADGEQLGDWLAMGPADDYAEGSGTPGVAGPLGAIYVMRGPNGTYALDLEPDSCGEGENETWDPQRLQVLLECPDGTDARFERDGSPVPGNPPDFSDPLVVRPMITAWNGNLLVNVRSTVGGIAHSAWP